MELNIISFSFLPSFFFILFIIGSKILKKKPIITPPGPWRLPFVGNLHQLATDQPHRRLTELAKMYGPIMHIQLGQVQTVIISSEALAKQVLKTQETHFLERPFILAAEIMLYNRTDIIFAPYGDYWRRMKKIAILELLSAKRVCSFRSVREDQVSNFIEKLHSEAVLESPVNLSHELLSLTNSIIAITSVGNKFKKQEEMISVITVAIVAAGGFSIADAFPSFNRVIPVVTGMRFSLGRIHRKADEILEEIIKEHKENRAAEMSKNEADNILDVLLDIQENGDLEFCLTTNNIKAMILEMFGAASDTSSSTIEWAMSEMMRNPCIMQKAQKEVRQVCGIKGTMDEEDLHELKYLKMVIKETLRLHPPLALIPRECREKSQLNGYDIYPKTRVLVNVWAIGRDPKSWKDPERFYPERFDDSSIDFKGNDFEFLPFGAGKRICPGITMAMVNIELIIARMLYHFDWKLPVGAESKSLDMSESFGLAIKRKTDLILTPIPYDPILRLLN
ncbi:cytochrome P450 family 71 subfamily B polypeptide 2 [Euphorbia peplus]|nr:putative cytochrome P450 monooxygenase [Euphorbia peplus]WCJ37093.1 cytochrome P450 family 71 subfamily B polypeptide 2 [Euphorbia peplus]